MCRSRNQRCGGYEIRTRHSPCRRLGRRWLGVSIDAERRGHPKQTSRSSSSNEQRHLTHGTIRGATGGGTGDAAACSAARPVSGGPAYAGGHRRCSRPKRSAMLSARRSVMARTAVCSPLQLAQDRSASRSRCPVSGSARQRREREANFGSAFSGRKSLTSPLAAPDGILRWRSYCRPRATPG